MPTTRADTPGDRLRVVVLVTRWHPEIVDRLREGAVSALADLGVDARATTVLEVPGAYELPQAAMRVARSGRADAIVALGCILRGETPHAEILERACARGLLEASLETGVPVGFGVITAETRAQAEARSDPEKRGGKGGHKGAEAAEAAVRLAATLRAWEAGS
jgi:6,7-dimethyl-8-ribityllumazine synthase